jgi:hypothetical protein
VPVTEIIHERVPIDAVQPHPMNPRVGETERIEESLDVHGQFRSIVVQRSTGYVLAGNHTWRAARQHGLADIDVGYIDVDDHEAYQVMLADNRLGDLGRYDDAQLLVLLNELQGDLTGTGYTLTDVDDLAALLAAPTDPHGEDDDDVDLGAFWPTIRATVDPPTFERWRSWRQSYGDDRAAMTALLERAS